METTKNRLPPNAKVFFDKLGNYLNTKIYYFGSIQRYDYQPKSSDIDIDIFTDNEQQTINYLMNFLGLNKYEFKKFVYRLHKTNKLVYGHKVKYKEPHNNFSVEISIYNENDKFEVLLEHNSKIDIPFYISVLLIMLKQIFYNFNLISKTNYKYIKKLIINNLVEGRDTEFVMTDIPKHKEEQK
jgi:predicted nucleotidyltransferase